jgi:hypothetical protein
MLPKLDVQSKGDYVELRTEEVYGAEGKVEYMLYEVSSGRQVLPINIENEQVDENVVKVYRTYHLQSPGYYLLLELHKTRIAVKATELPSPWSGPPVVLISSPDGSVDLAVLQPGWRYKIYPLIIKHGKVYTVNELIIEGETIQWDEIVKALKKAINIWRSLLFEVCKELP